MQFAIRKPGGLHTPPPSLRHIIDIIPCVSALSAQLTHMIKVDEPYISTHSQRKENPVCEDAYNTTHHGIYTLLDFPHLLGLCGALPATWYVLCFHVVWGILSAETWPDCSPATSDLPPAVWKMCAGGANATIVHSSAPMEGANDVTLTTGSCIDDDTGCTLAPTTLNDYHGRLTIAIEICSTIPPNTLS